MDLIEYLGKQFVEKNIAARYGISFMQYVEMVQEGQWELYKAYKDKKEATKGQLLDILV